MRTHQDDDMPAEIDFGGAVRPDRPMLADGPVAIVVTKEDGQPEERLVQSAARPDYEAVGPNSVSGIVDDVLHFIYNPDNDFVSMRLLSSFDERVVLDDEDTNGIRALRSEQSSHVVGMTVRGYLARFGATGQLGADRVELTVRSGLSVFAKVLRAA